MSIVVPCVSGDHRVRLAPKRFWASARCPTCKRSVDPTRVRRILAWVRHRYRRSARTKSGRFAWAASWIYMIVALLIGTVLWSLGDRWWVASIFLFGPRWVTLAPIIILLPLAVLQRQNLIPLALATVILVGPVMGFRTGWRSWFGRGEHQEDLRVITFNVAHRPDISAGEFSQLMSLEPDIVAFQECNPGIPNLIFDSPDWFFENSGGLCLLSRFPIDSIARQERDVLGRAGGAGWVIGYTIRTPGGPVQLTNLHLNTPRSGFEHVLRGRVTRGARVLASTSGLREIEASRARRFVDGRGGSFIVLGDFNTPIESVIYQRHWEDLENAFSRSGFGFGSTRFNGWIRVRIDHVLMSEDWRSVRAFVGPDLGSDHRPMIADLRRKDGGRR